MTFASIIFFYFGIVLENAKYFFIILSCIFFSLSFYNAVIVMKENFVKRFLCFGVFFLIIACVLPSADLFYCISLNSLSNSYQDENTQIAAEKFKEKIMNKIEINRSESEHE